jgi:hypothetical protein
MILLSAGSANVVCRKRWQLQRAELEIVIAETPCDESAEAAEEAAYDAIS